MPKYKVRMWYTSPRYKDIEVEAENVSDLKDKVREVFWDEDTATWKDTSDPDFSFDVEGGDETE